MIKNTNAKGKKFNIYIYIVGQDCVVGFNRGTLVILNDTL